MSETTGTLNPGAYRVLVVDDEPDVLATLLELIKSYGYQVTGASSGPEAQSIVATEPIDVVITDLMMPEMSGWQLLASVKTTRPDTNVVVITGYVPEEGRKILEDRSADGYLVKPIDSKRLSTLLKGLIFRQNLGRQAEAVILDDETTACEAMQEALIRRGVFAEAFTDPGEALTRIQKDPPDLVVLDVHLGAMSGLDFCKAMRKRASEDLAVLIVTSDPTREHVTQSIELGVDGFVVKPFEPKKFGEKALQILRRRGLGRAS